MPHHILIVPDKFKGTLRAPEAAAALGRGWQRERPDDEIELLPMTDGGDGFGEIMSRILGAECREAQVMDAAHRPITAQWWFEPSGQTAIVEAAQANGLAQLPPGQYHPFALDTHGVGLLLRAARAAGARRCLVGIGGSATNDAGFGLARALGWSFLDHQGRVLERWTDLGELTRAVPPATAPGFEEVSVAVDVQNPLLGATGCSRIYGPQKGLKESDFGKAEACLARLAELARPGVSARLAETPGAGAAGGLGFGLMCFAEARRVRGFELFARHARLDERLGRATLVLTGEGAVDESTLMGKGVGELAALCRRRGVPCIAVAGVVSAAARSQQLLHRLYCLTPDLTSREEAMGRPAHWLEETAARAAREYHG